MNTLLLIFALIATFLYIHEMITNAVAKITNDPLAVSWVQGFVQGGIAALMWLLFYLTL